MPLPRDSIGGDGEGGMKEAFGTPEEGFDVGAVYLTD